MIPLNSDQQAMLDGIHGKAKQMGMRLVLDLAAAANATELVPITTAHLSGVSPLTGGLGLRQFLAKLGQEDGARVAVHTTLNSAGCDPDQFEEMGIVAPNFLEHNQEIVAAYTKLGVQPTQSCIPYEWEGVVTEGVAAWAESNAICFGNSYTGLLTNRESGLSALAAALTGYTPKYGLLTGEEVRRPNLEVTVTASMDDPTDFSILGDWFGTQRTSDWKMPLGPIPLLRGLPDELSHEQRKALTAAAANYGCAILYLEGDANIPDPDFQDHLAFSDAVLAGRYGNLMPKMPASLIVIGCPQASVGELRAVAELLQGKQVQSTKGGKTPPLWVFTSSANLAIAERTGIAQIIRDAGALLLQHTCPEVVPYDQNWVKHVLTNSMKAEHYIKSGLNGIPTSVMRLADCVAVATGEAEVGRQDDKVTGGQGDEVQKRTHHATRITQHITQSPSSNLQFTGKGLPSQTDFTVRGEAFVTSAPITLLGFVNRETGVIEEEGHPANGESMAGKIAIFPKGSGSTVAPYVLLELYYRGMAPLAICNTDIDQQSAPACSLEGIPYAYGFNAGIFQSIKSGDLVELQRTGDEITIRKIVTHENGNT
jgi:predicted aconitase/predicted aconitase with swiveling domain